MDQTPLVGERVYSEETCTIEWPAGLAHGSSFRFGLVMPIWNRYELLRNTLQSLKESDMRDAVLVLIDDGSDDLNVRALLRSFGKEGLPVIKIYRIDRMYGGMIGSALRVGWDVLTRYLDCRYIGVLDSDVVMRPHWLRKIGETIDAVEKEHPKFMLTGFNSASHKVKKVFPDYVVKYSMGGLNIIFPASIYQSVVRISLCGERNLWDVFLTWICSHQSIPLLATRPSVVQHKGAFGLWSNGFLQHDTALDYYLPALNAHPFIYQLLYWNKRLWATSLIFLRYPITVLRNIFAKAP